MTRLEKTLNSNFMFFMRFMVSLKMIISSLGVMNHAPSFKPPSRSIRKTNRRFIRNLITPLDNRESGFNMDFSLSKKESGFNTVPCSEAARE